MQVTPISSVYRVADRRASSRQYSAYGSKTGNDLQNPASFPIHDNDDIEVVLYCRNGVLLSWPSPFKCSMKLFLFC